GGGLMEKGAPRSCSCVSSVRRPGAGAAVRAAFRLVEDMGAVVSRGGRLVRAGDALPLVKAPTLLIVGGHDETVIELNQDAYARLRCEKVLRVIPGATHLFEEPGALEQVADLAADWLKRRLQSLPAQIRAAGGAEMQVKTIYGTRLFYGDKYSEIPAGIAG